MIWIPSMPKAKKYFLIDINHKGVDISNNIVSIKRKKNLNTFHWVSTYVFNIIFFYVWLVRYSLINFEFIASPSTLLDIFQMLVSGNLIVVGVRATQNFSQKKNYIYIYTFFNFLKEYMYFFPLPPVKRNFVSHLDRVTILLGINCIYH